MTQHDIYQVFGISTSAPDYDIESDEDILTFIKVCIATSDLFEDMRLFKALDEIREEIEGIKKQPLIDYVSSIAVVDTALEIIDKHIKEIEGSDTE